MKKKMITRIIAVMMCSLLLFGCTVSGVDEVTNPENEEAKNEQANVINEEAESTEKNEDSKEYKSYAGMTADEILAELTLQQKAAQMVMPAIYYTNETKMLLNDYGSILSKAESVSFTEWQDIVDGFQERALASDAGVPYIYGQDDVHGVNYATGTVLFPHNIGLGAANDPELMYQVGLITADEAKLCHMLWNFSPCVAQSVDPRWGRTYESYGADLDIITSLSTQYTKGLIDGGVVACAKHFFADGNVAYGTGENSDVARLIDRGDAILDEQEIAELLAVYQAQIDAGVQTIMISHSALNGVKMHENAEYIQYLKNDMGFDGMIVSDWDSVQNTSGESYEEQVITAINAGIDMLMEVSEYDEAMNIIISAVESGKISEDRVNDAVRRILQMKIDAGLMDDPFLENMETVQSETGSKEYRDLAEKLVEESLVLIKNEGNVLPLKENASVYIMGPAMDDAKVQCGGWTIDWLGTPYNDIEGVTTVLEGFGQVAAEKGINLITDESQASEADVIVLVVGEEAYAEWCGDAENMDLCGDLGLPGNAEAIEKAKSYGKPIVTLIVAGRQVFISDYEADWDAVVMCYLPGSEGQGIANVLCGNAEFTGKLPSPWYSSNEQIGTDECWKEIGYGLEY